MKEGKERVIYNNYDLCDCYEEAKEFLMEEYPHEDGTEPADEEVWQLIYHDDALNWEETSNRLQEFFSSGCNKYGYILVGTLGLWNGSHTGGFVFDDWDDLTMKGNIFEGCHYVKMYDINGHFFIKCSHHDGTNCYEIKELTKNGRLSVEKWEYNWNDDRKPSELHKSIFKNNSLSRLPHFAHKVYGCKKKEHEKKTA